MKKSVPLSDLPELLKTIRKQRSLTQTQAAERLGPGYSKGHISYIESGKRAIGLALLKKFCKIYDCDFEITVK